ncbi:gastrula zinc finger protein XlCGF46.1 [Episyrphus balteatus]|uniref:gastrula zinc finger protein XlCGF46.1 n=1 Tax=Episyrphus balteatus TaxID=286459 RepID=UPI00248532C8|nr:gastrula zinc finger protein XlCGF46.1 [Episyrphus balteatus]XP_055851409.1 gastrula zinc finger protein XlCGF46.1 [Episyrphus balteatus]XP_055851410.1 gastrula zinc finger protein XlCGF46.1 [Episyrphus balteatus]
MTELMICPICKKPLNNQNRLITEDCGHSKCRQCLISEVNGCEKCKQNTTIHSNEAIQTNSNDELLKTNEKPLQKASKTKKSTIPSHIVKTQGEDNKTIYHCTICDKHFKSRTQQYYHLFCNNSSNKPFKCDECSKYFSTSAHLKYHKAGHSQQSFECSVCSKQFPKIQILKKHEKLHKAIAERCNECGVTLRNKEALDAHMKRHQNILPFKCKDCDKKFSLQTSLRMHQQIVHMGAKKFKCEICGKVFNRNSSLKTHSISHSGQKEHSCSKCPRYFIDKKSLMRHSRIHNVKSKYKCTLCDTSSIRKDNILRHIRNMHPNEDKTCMEEVTEEYESSENESSDNEKVVSKNVPDETSLLTTDSGNLNYIPKIIVNSSVIRCIGNVKPVTIIDENQSKPKAVEQQTPAAVTHPIVTIHKKLKKAYDPHEIYRKILYDEDSTQDNDTNSNVEETTNTVNEQTKQLVQESTVICNGQQSNFSETHWRKNFKHNYQIQFD